MAKAVEKFWIFTCPEGTDNNTIDIVGGTRMTPAESTFYFGIPNLFFVGVNGIPVPFMPQAYQYAETFVPLKNVGWSIVESGGLVFDRSVDFVCDLANKYDNVNIAFLDDFFDNKTHKGVISASELTKIKEKVSSNEKSLEIWLTLYTYQLEFPIQEYLPDLDAITLWTWKDIDLKNLSGNFERLEKLAPDKKKLLGCYLYDYEARRAVSVENMEMQCEIGLEWLKSGRIDGMVFLGNTIVEAALETSRWLRKWIEKVKDVDVPDKA